jgi:hypothetical protein
MSNPEENIEPMNLAEADTGDDEDHNYVPSFIAKLLDNPQLLPSYYREDFEFIFEKFEFSHLGEAKTTLEYIEVYQATMLTLDIERYEHMKDAILLNQRRPAVEALFRKTHEGAAMAGAEQAVRIDAGQRAARYFADPAYKALADKSFEAAGYAPAALEGEAFLSALPTLALIERQIAQAQKRLIALLKDLELRFSARNAEKTMIVAKTVSRAPKAKPSNPGGS